MNKRQARFLTELLTTECPACLGAGHDDHGPCETCQGTGTVAK